MRVGWLSGKPKKRRGGTSVYSLTHPRREEGRVSRGWMFIQTTVVVSTNMLIFSIDGSIIV